MKSVRIKPEFLLRISVFCALFAATYRGDADGAGMDAGGTFSDVVQSPIVSALKSVSIFAFVIPVISALVVVILKMPIKNVIGRFTSILMFLSLILIVRLIPEAPQISVKILVASGVISLIVILAMCSAANARGDGRVANAIFSGAFAFALAHSLINAGMVVTGLGKHHLRFLGTSAHPNFIGVQMACCATLMLGGLQRSISRRSLATIGIAAAVTALVAAGSRTGLIVFGVGFSIYWAIRGLKAWQAIGLVLLVPLVGVILTTAVFSGANVDVSMNQYDRSGVNTRAEAWQEMWQAVTDSPVIGNGLYPQASESSYLRGWAAIGIIYIICYAWFALVSIYSGFIISRRKTKSSVIIAFVAVIFGLLSGGITEGFLLDTLSFPIILLIAATIALDSDKVKKTYLVSRAIEKTSIAARPSVHA